MIVGIDPGFSGAIAFLDKYASNNRIEIQDLPLKMIMGRKQIDGSAFSKLLTRPFIIRFAVIEDVAAMPGNGSVSMFRFGFNAGVLHGVLESLGIKLLRVKPAVWKSALGLDSNKKNSLILARRIFPKSQHYFTRAKDDGRAEAALLAHFAKTSI